ncbi:MULTISPECIES: hypothetical protein [unclassified Stenotrophomonas]|uniref:hypothetical protein n=1 Tax=unclassified Stenotrophomonas TaxID=196198 RepID=UPI0013110D88|nr:MULTISPECIES: hypothetical protein [unclassified Stenotrophomonas]MBN5158220.1 hypothetical protein [Stenotrophomonas maltophilia]MDG9842727.1 hypothetical protein [Stenotrophomonas sp. GD04054]MDH0015631.1 hypothetical protein [Stenotrophomonas sp. GD04028]MDH0575272.1 hypothetical protein [Stenotrophomonas sp. GD03997]MDH0858983.1 hypothetical protein [Stenotrophomonas sp. GD03882]
MTRTQAVRVVEIERLSLPPLLALNYATPEASPDCTYEAVYGTVAAGGRVSVDQWKWVRDADTYHASLRARAAITSYLTLIEESCEELADAPEELAAVRDDLACWRDRLRLVEWTVELRAYLRTAVAAHVKREEAALLRAQQRRAKAVEAKKPRRKRRLKLPEAVPQDNTTTS